MVVSRLTIRVLVLASLLTLAGCAALSGDGPDSTTTASQTHTTTPTFESRNAISVVNEQSKGHIVTVQVVSESVTALNLTHENGTVVTHQLKNPNSVPSLRLREWVVENNVTAVEPANTTTVARWSADLDAHSTVTLPFPVERQNVTILIVVSEKEPHTPPLAAIMARCPPQNTPAYGTTFSNLSLRIGEGSFNWGGGGSCS